MIWYNFYVLVPLVEIRISISTTNFHRDSNSNMLLPVCLDLLHCPRSWQARAPYTHQPIVYGVHRLVILTVGFEYTTQQKYEKYGINAWCVSYNTIYVLGFGKVTIILITANGDDLVYGTRKGTIIIIRHPNSLWSAQTPLGHLLSCAKINVVFSRCLKVAKVKLSKMSAQLLGITSHQRWSTIFCQLEILQ